VAPAFVSISADGSQSVLTPNASCQNAADTIEVEEAHPGRCAAVAPRDRASLHVQRIRQSR